MHCGHTCGVNNPLTGKCVSMVEAILSGNIILYAISLLPHVHTHTDREVRLSMLLLHLASVPTALSDVEWALLASKTEGYSGSDIATFCSDAAMMPVRELEGATHWKVLTGETSTLHKWSTRIWCKVDVVGATTL